MRIPSPPIVLSISGHDPSGGAGIQADIEAITALGCKAATVVTCLTVQDTVDVRRIAPLSPELVEAQLQTLLNDIKVRVIKIGLLGDAAVADTLAAVLRGHPEIPVILDPVLAAGGGRELAARDLIRSIRGNLLPQTHLITPNAPEARRLTDRPSLEECARDLLQCGCKAVLITGTHEQEPEVTNLLYRKDREPLHSTWARLEGSYHGSGCTLASSIAALLAKGLTLEQAVLKGQEYTWNTLSFATAPGKGQSLPDRFFRYREKQ
jgi:hydroxymethylpyrimidine/phosphomethylpyrimidine kinase